MKKCILFLCALLLLAALAGCGGQTSVDTGSPGDAQTDAPPEGQSLNYNADTVPETPVTATTPMVFVEGALYVSTGQVSDVEGRCGNMDGEITSQTANGTDAPTENGQSNFGTGYGYQRIDDHIEVLIDNQWIVFKPITDSDV